MANAVLLSMSVGRDSTPNYSPSDNPLYKERDLRGDSSQLQPAHHPNGRGSGFRLE